MTPGSGKTRLSAAIATGALNGGFARSVHAIVPTTALKIQWATEFAAANLRLETNYRSGGHLAGDMHGVVVTYQQLVERPQDFAKLFRGGLVIIDEIHHAGEQGAWGKALALAGSSAAHRVHLSGTPFRSDASRIAHLTYDGRGYVVADYSYGYAQAVADQIVRPIVAYPATATVKWKSADGTIRESSFEERSPNAKHDAERLRAVLTHAGWVGSMLERGARLLEGLRRREPDAGGLVACMTAAHARGVATIMQRELGIDPVVILSEDEDADRRLAEFRHGRAPWIVAVRKVSEGIDIPRLRTLVYLTNTRTELIFRQLVGRIVRIRDGDVRPGYLLYPADPTLDALVRQMHEEVVAGAASGSGAASRSHIAAIDDDPAVAELEVLEATYGELSPYAAIQATVNPDDLFVVAAPKETAQQREERSSASIAERDALRRQLHAVVNEVAHHFRLTQHDIYSHFARLREPLDKADANELTRRIATMRKWINQNKHPVTKRRR